MPSGLRGGSYHRKRASVGRHGKHLQAWRGLCPKRSDQSHTNCHYHSTGGRLPVVPCKTRSDIPKDRIFDCVRALRDLTVAAPIHIGDILLPDVCGTGVDIIATADMEKV